MSKKSELQQLKKIVEEFAVDAFIRYNVDFFFHGFDGDVQTVYVRETLDSPNPVEFYMLDEMLERIQKINSRYAVGILYTEKSKEAEEFNEFR
jgi:hypothetical protein